MRLKCAIVDLFSLFCSSGQVKLHMPIVDLRRVKKGGEYSHGKQIPLLEWLRKTLKPHQATICTEIDTFATQTLPSLGQGLETPTFSGAEIAKKWTLRNWDPLRPSIGVFWPMGEPPPRPSGHNLIVFFHVLLAEHFSMLVSTSL